MRGVGARAASLRRHRIWLVWILLSFPMVTLVAPGIPRVLAADDELRTWSDATGKFKIKAKMISVDDGVVTLQLEDDSETEIELKKLSAADQKFVADAQKAAAQKGDSDSPFKKSNPFKKKAGAEPKPAKKKAPSAEPSEEDDNEAMEADTAGATPPKNPKIVKVKLPSAGWLDLKPPSEKWRASPGEPADVFPEKLKAVPLPPKTNFFEGMKGLAVNAAAKKAVVGFVLGGDGGRREGATTRIVLCDLATGKASSVATETANMVPVALHDDGRRIVMLSDEFGFGKHDRLEVWTHLGSKIGRWVVWFPYDTEKGAARDVMAATFVDSGRLLTTSRNGKVVLWKFPEIRPIFMFNLGDGAIPAVSPDRKTIAYCNGGDVGLFDLTKRQVGAQQKTPQKMINPEMAFSPSGQKLACFSFNQVLVWDVASGKLEQTVSCDGSTGNFQFPDEDFVLMNGGMLVDLKNQLRLWNYSGAEEVRTVGRWSFCGVTDGDKNPGLLMPLQLPHATARDTLKKSLTEPDLFVLKAGTTVKLNLAGLPDAGQRNAVQQALVKRLQAIGCQAGDAGTIELAAVVEGPKQEEISFFGGGTYKIQQYLSRVSFSYQGKRAWERSKTNVPGIVSLKQGENMEGHLRNLEKPDYAFFDQVELPKYLQKPGASGAGTLGESRLTTAGLR